MILTVIGARPQFVKAAVVSKAFQVAGIAEDIIHTGQHYDDKMSSVFWDELGIPPYLKNLNTGSGTHARQTADIMVQLEDHVLSNPGRYKAMMIYGDTNSTLAGALVAVKSGLKLIHIESGLRSFNREMPEEINRIVADRLSDILFCSSEAGVAQLATEGCTGQVHDCGDVMYDAVNTFLPIAMKQDALADQPELKQGGYALLTLHRPANVDDPEQLQRIFAALARIPERIYWPVHPRTASRLGTLNVPSNIHIIGPLSYLQMLCALHHCGRVLTDSGGLQKEAYWMKRPCITLRTETEWTETLEQGWNTLVRHFHDADSISSAYAAVPDPKTWKPLYGDGDAAGKIARVLKKAL